MTSATADSAPADICQAIKARTRFVITSHARPDGDSIGSQLAMAYALDLLGKQVRLVNADPAPEHYLEFPGVDRIEIAREASVDDVDAVIVMESGDLARTGVNGTRRTLHDQHRSPPGQQPLRRHQLVRRVRGRLRRDGVRADPQRSAFR